MNCRFCSRDLPEGARFCQSCGARVEPQRVMPSEVPSAPRWQAQAPTVGGAVAGTLGRDYGAAVGVAQGEAAARDDEALYIDPLHIIYMSIISAGLYSLYWLFLTWKQLQRETRENHHAVWHVLAVYVPIYGLFRTHKHVEVIRDLSLRAGRGTNLVPIVFVFVFGIGTSLNLVASLTGVSLLSALLVDVFGMAIDIALLLWAQSDLNTYWLHSRRERLSETRLGVGEVIITGLGALTWLTYLG
jgi:hypothetical protein